MGSALLRGWCDVRVAVIEPNPLSDLPAQAVQYPHLSAFCDQISDENWKPSLVVFAIKPQVIESVVQDYARFKPATFLSIAAGKPLAVFERLLGKDAAIVRAMPNTPAAIGQGITVCVANDRVPGPAFDLVTNALAATGKVEWLADESLMDAVTALSGSGPAYVFHLVEVLATAGEQLGLAPDLAMKLARQTVIGSGHLLQQSPQSAAELREAVTSPGGTTAAALKVLGAESSLQELFSAALRAAHERGRELS